MEWQTGKSVLESNRHMLQAQLHCDVTFTFQDGQAEVRGTAETR